MLITPRRRLSPRIGAWCWRHKANRRRHMRHLKSFAGFIGGPFTALCGDKGAGPEEAQDLTQGFFALLLERRDLRTVRKEKGRLRSYLLSAVKHFLADEHRRAMAIKRGKGQQLIPLEELRTEERSGMEPADPLTAERIYERRWASTLLDRVLSRLEDTYRKRGNAALFDSFNQLLADEPGAPSQADIAAQLGIIRPLLVEQRPKRSGSSWIPNRGNRAC